ncbi:MAG: DUF6680 family protein [Stellaceae bacterium]
MNPSSAIFGWAILAATFLGPIFAVLAARYIEWHKEIKNRRLYIFRTLMATRRAQLTTEHVTALNLIEIDFEGENDVLIAWQAYFKNLCCDPKSEGFQRALNERPQLLAKLLHAIARTLNYNIEQLDIMAGGYYPQLFYDNVQKQQEIQELLAEQISGKRPLLVKIVEEGTSRGSSPKSLFGGANRVTR